MSCEKFTSQSGRGLFVLIDVAGIPEPIVTNK